MPSESTQVTFPTVDGGRAPLSKRQRRAISYFTDAIRSLPDEQVTVLIELLFEFRADSYLDRVRSYELPTLKILAEVINGWEPGRRLRFHGGLGQHTRCPRGRFRLGGLHSAREGRTQTAYRSRNAAAGCS